MSLRAVSRDWTVCALLFCLNAYICQELFWVEFTRHLQSNEGAFIALTRFFLENGIFAGWFPWWNGGMPVQNAYPPLLPGLAALLSACFKWTPAHAFHFMIAAMYCVGPVALFLFAQICSGRFGPSIFAATCYSLLSPSAILIPKVRFDNGGPWNPQRFNNVVFFGESPHVSALTLVAVALLFCYLSLRNRRLRYYALAIVSSRAVALTDTIGATTLLVGAVCLLLAGRKWADVFLLATIGGAAYCLISPWMPPSVLRTLRENSWTAGGDYRITGMRVVIPAAVCILLVLLFFLIRERLPFFERFLVFFAFTVCAIPVLDYALNFALLPQPRRYHLEFEMACCLVGAFAVWRIPKVGRDAALVALALLFVRQITVCRNYARTLVEPVMIGSTIEYRVAHFLDEQLRGSRVMISGDAAYWTNVFFDMPQFSGGHEPSAPNWMQRVAVYTIYSGMNAGARDAEISVFWLKAFGNSAIYVPGPHSKEFFHPFVNPAKFDGVSPVLWREEDDTIYQVPVRSQSLAHVIPEDAMVMHAPLHGLDLGPARRYVAAIDDVRNPEPTLQWRSPDRGTIEALLKPGQLISWQTTYDPGWHAYINGSPRSVLRDGLGLMIVKPECSGTCQVDVIFEATPEIWLCRFFSFAASSGIFLRAVIILRRRRNRIVQFE